MSPNLLLLGVKSAIICLDNICMFILIAFNTYLVHCFIIVLYFLVAYSKFIDVVTVSYAATNAIMWAVDLLGRAAVACLVLLPRDPALIIVLYYNHLYYFFVPINTDGRYYA